MLNFQFTNEAHDNELWSIFFADLAGRTQKTEKQKPRNFPGLPEHDTLLKQALASLLRFFKYFR
jgi:hypothetical protein